MLLVKTIRLSQYRTISFVILFLLSLNKGIGQVNILEDNNIDNLDLARLISVTEDKLTDNLFEVDKLLVHGYRWADQKEDSGSKCKLNRIKAKLHFDRAEIDLGISLLKENLTLIQNPRRNGNELALNHLLLSEFFVVKRDFENAQKHLNVANNDISKSEISSIEQEMLTALGFFHLEKRSYKQASEYYSQALYLAKQEEDSDQIAIQTGNLAKLKVKTGERSESLAMSLASLKMNINQLTRARAYTNIGAVYFYLQDWLSAEEYLEKSIELKKKIGVGNGIVDDLNGLGTCYSQLKKYTEAISALEQSLKIKNEQSIYPGLVLGNLASVYIEKGNFEKANFYFDEYVFEAKKHKDWEGLSGLYYNRGFSFFTNSKYELALEQFEKSYDIGLERVPGPLFLIITDMLSKTHEKLGNIKEAKFHLDEFNTLNKKFSEIETLKKVGAVENNMDSTNIQLEDNEKTADKISESSYMKFFVWIFCIALFVMLLIYYRGSLLKKEVVSAPQDNDKLDLYFQELFDRLDQRGDKKTQVIPPVSDMPEFLKRQLSESDGWEAFDSHFEKVHKNFYKNLKLGYPSITSNDLNMCALLKLNINNKDIAQIMGISYDSVRKSQQRLSKKMNLEDGIILRDFILQF